MNSKPIMSIMIVAIQLMMFLMVSPLKAQGTLETFTLEAELGRGNAATAAWSPDGTKIAVGGRQGIRLYTNTFQDILSLELPPTADSVSSVAWSPDSQRLVAVMHADEGYILQIWDVITGAAVVNALAENVLEGPLIAWSPDQSKIALIATQNIDIWDQNLQLLRSLVGHTDVVSDIAWHPDSIQFASISIDDAIHIWNTTNGQSLATLQSPEQTNIPSVAWSPDGTQLASSSNTNITIWNTASASIAINLQGHTNQVVDLSWSSNGLASTSRDDTIKVWNVATGQVIYTQQGVAGSIKFIAWNPISNNILVLGADNLLRIWAPGTNNYSATLYHYIRPVDSISWNPSGTQIVSGENFGRVQVWDISQEQVVGAISDASRSSIVLSVAWQPSGSIIAYGDNNGGVHFWDVSTNQFTIPFQNSDVGMDWLAWSLNSVYLAGLDRAGLVKVWNTVSNQTIALSSPCNCVKVIEWNPDSTLLAAGGEDGFFQVWNIASNQVEGTLQGHTDDVVGIAWSSDGTRLVSVGRDRTIRIWNTSNYELISTIQIETDAVFAVAWRPGHQEFVTAEVGGLHFRNASGEETSVIVHRAGMRYLTWSSDGNRLAGLGANSRITIWTSSVIPPVEQSPTPAVTP